MLKRICIILNLLLKSSNIKTVEYQFFYSRDSKIGNRKHFFFFFLQTSCVHFMKEAQQSSNGSKILSTNHLHWKPCQIKMVYIWKLLIYITNSLVKHVFQSRFCPCLTEIRLITLLWGSPVLTNICTVIIFKWLQLCSFISRLITDD